jgi:hypothetical protein
MVTTSEISKTAESSKLQVQRRRYSPVKATVVAMCSRVCECAGHVVDPSYSLVIDVLDSLEW